MTLWPLRGMPEITAGADLGGALVEALHANGLEPQDGDVLVVSSKVISKATGLSAPVEARAGLVLAESDRVVAERAGPAGITRVVATLAGPVLAGAGIDASNLGGDGGDVLLLPREPDRAACTVLHGVIEALRGRGAVIPDRLGVLVTDTAGRPWRAGQADIAIGAAGVPVVEDLRGGSDADGRPLAVTVRAIADELAAAADLVKGKTWRVPAALVRGWVWPAAPRTESADQAGAGALVRRGPTDWFALGHVEAVRAALGVPPGTHAAVDIGIRAAGPVLEDVTVRIARACALALHDGLGEIPPGHPRAHVAGPRPGLASARLDVVQYGVAAEAPDDLTLGVLVGRLLPALAAEDIPAAFARTEPAGPGRGPRALIVFTDETR